jgi:uncharacterized protein YkwD
MKTHPYIQILAAFCIGALASCAKPPAPVTTTRMPVSASLRPDGSVSSRLYQEVNSYRRSQGARELERHAGLDRLAQEHSEYLRQHRGTFTLQGKNVSHIGFEGRALIARERYQMQNVSENVAATSKVPGSITQRLVSLWVASKDHHQNMVDDWTYTGVGVVVDSDGMVFATQLFSTVGNSQMALRERFNQF